MKYQDSKGFTLILVIIMTSIIIFIGTYMIKLTSTNYKMKKLNSISKKNFYIAEAGIEEAYIILNKHVQESINYSYEKLNEYEDISSLEDTEILKVYSSENEKNELFKRIYKEHIKTVDNKLKNVSQYNLNKIEGYTFQVNTSISQSSKDDELILNITISYDNKKVLENIRVKYSIKTPEYGAINSSNDLINKIDWLNTKW